MSGPSEDRVEITKSAIYWRGLFITRYAAVELAIAELVTAAWSHPAYLPMGAPPFGPTKKLRRARAIVEATGPVAAYGVAGFLDELEKYEGYRHFMAHALMVAQSRADILFKMYDHREGVHSEGRLNVSLDQMRETAERIFPVSNAFVDLVAKILREIFSAAS